MDRAQWAPGTGADRATSTSLCTPFFPVLCSPLRAQVTGKGLSPSVLEDWPELQGSCDAPEEFHTPATVNREVKQADTSNWWRSKLLGPKGVTPSEAKDFSVTVRRCSARPSLDDLVLLQPPRQDLPLLSSWGEVKVCLFVVCLEYLRLDLVNDDQSTLPLSYLLTY